MILLEEDIQQLRKIKGTGEQIFNFSTLRAAFKGVSRQKVKSKPVLNAACCLYITLQNYENKSSCIVINKLFISINIEKSTAWKKGVKKREAGRGGGEDQFGRLKVEIIKPLHSLQSWFKKIRMQRQDKVTRRHQSPSPVPRCFFPFSVQVHAFKVPSFCIQYIK